MIKLVHGTSAEFLEQIKENGLVARRLKQSQWDAAPSHPDWVYLSNAYALHFAMNAAKNEHDCLLVEVEVDEDKLYPDEDFLGQETSHMPPWCEDYPDLLERTQVLLAWSTTIGHNQRKELAETSLRKMGTVAHDGDIPKEQITRYVIIPKEDIPRIVIQEFDPIISTINYLVMGEHYHNLQLDFFTRYENR